MQKAETIDIGTAIAPTGRSASIVTPMEMLNQAVSSGASVEILERLMSLQERWEKGNARKAFDAAVSEAKAAIPVVQANREGHNKKRYADFSAIARVVDPILGQHGLSYRFRTRQDERIHVTCVLSHRDGHFEETTLSGPADATGSKNAIQAIGSTLTYLQRYSLVQALGLAASDDDDGKAADETTFISSEQLAFLTAAIDEAGADVAKFREYLGVSTLAELPASQYGKAMKALEQKRARR